MKLCSKCKEHKPFTEFGIQTKRRDGLRPWCKVCHNAQNAKWRGKNPEYYKSRQLQDPSRRSAYDAKYREKNPTYSKEYYEEHREAFIQRTNRRRTHSKHATALWADTSKIRLLYRLSANLNRLHGYVKYHVDHIVPLKGKLVSGLHVHNNLRILPAKQNKSKFNKWSVDEHHEKL